MTNQAILMKPIAWSKGSFTCSFRGSALAAYASQSWFVPLRLELEDFFAQGGAPFPRIQHLSAAIGIGKAFSDHRQLLRSGLQVGFSIPSVPLEDRADQSARRIPSPVARKLQMAQAVWAMLCYEGFV
jgi:hypothetical protein